MRFVVGVTSEGENVQSSAKVESADEFTRDFGELVTPYRGIPAALDGIRHDAAVLDELSVA